MDFDARVIGIPDFVHLMKEGFGRDEARFQEKKFHAAEKALLDALGGEAKPQVKELFHKHHQPCCHIHLERQHFLKGLDDWLKRHTECAAPSLRIMGHSDALVLPLEFLGVVQVELEVRQWPLPVVGALPLRDELQAIAEAMELDRFFRNRDLGDFIYFEREALKRTTKKHFLGENFWSRFAVVVMRHLADRCISSGMPLIIADRTLKPGA